MRKIVIIGCPGAGKTTFAERLRDKTGIELYYLDAIWHKPDRTHIPREKFDLILGEILVRDSWIIDGNYSRTLERRVAACDTVVFFDLPTSDCLEGAISRLGKERCGVPWIDTELDPELREKIIDFPKSSLPEIYRILERYKEGRKIMIFKSREEADAFVDTLSCGE